MDVLDKLQNDLRNINKLALGKLRPGDALQLYKEQSSLKSWLKNGSSDQLVTSPLTIETALRAYQQNRYLKGARQIRLVCYGCTQQHGAFRVIESREAFDTLLVNVDHYRNKRRVFRKFFRALLNGYFSYDPDAANATHEGRKNHAKLRFFLAKNLSSFVQNEFTPDWLATLIQYPDLLTEHPAPSLDVLQGDWSVFDEIRECLELDSASWLIRKIVMSPLIASRDMSDELFKDYLPSLLLLLHDYPMFARTGLKILLDRYAQCVEQEVHAALRDFAVELWGNPWLTGFAHQWQCNEAARKMLSHWLKRELLTGFFELLSNDDKVRHRRLNFWDIYSADLLGMYFALGNAAEVTGNQSLYQFRSHAKGLITKLPGENPNMHICIMQFKNFHVVEFNRENNIAYFYDIRQGTPSFYFGKGWLDIGAISIQKITKGTDIAGAAKQMRHQDNKQLTWEGLFAQELGVTDNAIKAFCKHYQCQHEDLRVTDGGQWIRPIYPDRYGVEVWSVLRGWGFKFLSDQNAYCQAHSS